MTKDIKIFSFEDDPLDAKSLSLKLEYLGFSNYKITDDFEYFSIFISESSENMLIISDIYYGNIPVGLKLIDLCRKKSLPLILVTHSHDRLVFADAFSNNQYAYLVKPFHTFTLASVINQTLSQNYSEKYFQEYLFVNINGRFKKKIYLNDIIFLESNQNYLNVYCTHGSYILRSSIIGIIDKLNKQFIQVHQKYLVNKNFIVSLAKDEVIMANKKKLPVGRTYKKNLE